MPHMSFAIYSVAYILNWVEQVKTVNDKRKGRTEGLTLESMLKNRNVARGFVSFRPSTRF